MTDDPTPKTSSVDAVPDADEKATPAAPAPGEAPKLSEADAVPDPKRPDAAPP